MYIESMKIPRNSGFVCFVLVLFQVMISFNKDFKCLTIPCGIIIFSIVCVHESIDVLCIVDFFEKNDNWLVHVKFLNRWTSELLFICPCKIISFLYNNTYIKLCFKQNMTIRGKPRWTNFHRQTSILVICVN